MVGQLYRYNRVVETKIDPIRARALIRQHVPSIAADDLVLLPHPGWGGDSDAFLVDHRWIFRFPRSRDVQRNLAVEVCLLPRLARRARIPIPRFSYVVIGDDGLPCFVGYEAIPGEPLRRSDLERLDRRAFEGMARQLGRFLRALHDTPLEKAVACGVELPRGDARDRWEQRRADLRRRVFPLLAADEQRWVEQRFAVFLADPRLYDARTTLCHGDLTSDHILYDAATNHLGIIDFGDVCIGDPAGDFVWRDEYGEEFFRAVLAHYGHPEDTTLAERVTFCLDLMPLTEISYAVEIGRDDYVAEGRQRLRERMGAESAGRG